MTAKPEAFSVPDSSIKTETWHDRTAKPPQINTPCISVRLRCDTGSAVTNQNRQGDNHESSTGGKSDGYGEACSNYGDIKELLRRQEAVKVQCSGDVTTY